MVDGREIDREWCASVWCEERESVWVLLCCVEDAVHQVVGSQILIGYEPKDSFIPLLLVCSCRPKLEVLFVLEIFCVCVFVCE